MPIYVEHPIAYYGALSAAMSACLYLFVSTARNVESIRSRFDRRLRDTELQTGVLGTQVAAIQSKVDDISTRTQELEGSVSSLAATRRPHTMTAGVDANQRTQVLRMARRGERPDRIAAELGVPKSEVDLLLKVQRAVARAV
ncbi:MAG TPA: hypothetical protein VFQ91_18615 [Bryobacteraceae bacterium]|nr:hypothetical protein [Bryobacteraceae bacterium]